VYNCHLFFKPKISHETNDPTQIRRNKIFSKPSWYPCISFERPQTHGTISPRAGFFPIQTLSISANLFDTYGIILTARRCFYTTLHSYRELHVSLQKGTRGQRRPDVAIQCCMSVIFAQPLQHRLCCMTRRSGDYIKTECE